ncbi:phage portal protein [Peribacillus loiseleuriae]|uniref:phage portal protein n=1 Tax=Peribacillus loiseleuriae TaxID=1679170 RepID=UPI003D02C864
MNPEVGSIMGFFYKVFPVKVYTNEVPENFAVPSLYFPTPFSFDGNDTNKTFMKSYSLPVKLFHKDSQLANNEAERIADTVRSKRSVIPLLNADGTETGDYVRISRIETRISDSGVASIIVNWDSRYHYDRDDYIAIENIEFDNEVKK